MNIYLLLAASCYFYLISSFSNPKCRGKRYRCGEENKENVCVNASEFTNKEHLLSPCPLGKFCPISNEVSFEKPLECVDNLPAKLLLPGEKCRTPEECLSGFCKEEVCKGTQSCESHENCDPGFFCDVGSKLCAEQKSFEEECTEDYQCLNNCVCNLKSCTFYYSLENGLPADNPKACYYGYINKTNSSCADGPISQIKGKPCEKDEECLLLDKSGHLAGNSACNCGFNAGSFSYCSLAEGDQEYLETINLFQWILYTNIKCHTLLRYGPCQYLYDDEVHNYHKALKYYEMLPEITFNDQCIKKIYTDGYWYLESEMMTAICITQLWLLVS